MSRRAHRADPETFALVAGGGTAGHVLPGLAVARELVERGHPPETIRFAGSHRGIETRLVPEAGFGLDALAGRGIRRSLSPANVVAVLALIRGVVEGVVLVRRLRPKVVVVLGGYAAVPCLVGALVTRVPVVVMEQNARAGLANRLAGRFARACAVAFPGTDLPRPVVTGNPVRPEVLVAGASPDRVAARSALGLPSGRTVLAVFSGSLGAGTINEATLSAVRRWADRSDLAVYHVVGRRDWESLPTPVDPPSGGLFYRSVPYEDRMATLLAAADLALCRAGGTTVAELAEVGLPSVLVPLPNAPRDHQRANARALVEAGAAVLVEDSELDGTRLVDVLDPLIGDPGRLAAMGRAAAGLSRPDAARRVADLVELHARGAG